MNRRELLVGTAGAGASLVVGPIETGFAASVKAQGSAGALPMPQPSRTLPPPALVQDPSRTLI